MKKAVFVSLILATALVACKQHGQPTAKNKPKADTLVYTYKTIKERAADCGTKPDSACSEAEITYAVFPGHQTLNDSIVSRLLQAYRSDKPDKTLEMQAKSFIQGYMTDTLRQTDSNKMIYTLETSARVVRQDSSLVTIQIDSYAFTGGAHGGTFTGYLNWNTSEDKKVTLSDIFTPGYQETFRKIAEKIFRSQEKLSDTSSLQSYFFKDAKFALNDNFLVTPVGIRFLYNEYEIKSYAEGQTELLIPYNKIKSLLRPQGVVSQYLK